MDFDYEKFYAWCEKQTEPVFVSSYEMPEKKAFLNALALYKERRGAYKGYLSTCLKHGRTLSPDELEIKYQRRLKRRSEKAGN